MPILLTMYIRPPRQHTNSYLFFLRLFFVIIAVCSRRSVCTKRPQLLLLCISIPTSSSYIHHITFVLLAACPPTPPFHVTSFLVTAFGGHHLPLFATATFTPPFFPPSSTAFTTTSHSGRQFRSHPLSPCLTFLHSLCSSSFVLALFFRLCSHRAPDPSHNTAGSATG